MLTQSSHVNIALVTGAAKRLGQALAVALSKAGFHIALHYFGSAPTETQQKIEANGQKVQLFRANLENLKEAEGLMHQVCQQMGKPSLLINSAALFHRASLKETSAELLQQEFNVNFLSPFLLAKEFATLCAVGHIINVVDAHILKNQTQHSAYLLTKKALVDFTYMAALEFAPTIRVNAIAPGPILPPPGQGEQYLKQVGERTPLQKPGHPQDVVDAVFFLIQHTYTTGQILYVDGGAHL